MDQRADHFGRLSRSVWELAEVGYQEHKSSALLQAELRAAGFRIETGTGGAPTAFVATWGEGKPVIGIPGEFDALPGLSQEDVAQRKPRTADAPGHGCGHNLLGAAAAFAAITVKEEMAARGIKGTLKFYGSPAEEGGGGKIYMARAGAFDGVDAVLAWHPSDRNGASLKSNLANISAKFRYRGKAAHAASAPTQGRSALDAVMVFAHAVDLLREHIPDVTRVHYIITNGGSAPNIVLDASEVFRYARHSSMPVLDGIWNRILKCAEAGALATETELQLELVNSSHNLLPNDALAALYDKNLRVAGGVEYTPAEQTFAETLRTTFSLDGAAPLGSEREIDKIDEGVHPASTDVGDVSWIVPTSEFRAATYVPGTPGHSWQSTACAGMSIGR